MLNKEKIVLICIKSVDKIIECVINMIFIDIICFIC